MSAIMTCEITSRPVAPAREKASLLARLAAALAREIRVRRDMRLLSSLDDAALHDIGLARGGMEDAVRHGRGSDTIVPAPGQVQLDSRDGATLLRSLVEWR
ncbi:MAG TPA: DUF1127 domain-containing protein [Microvirga sp.]|nr:DUF1127 domain-containing protein [Microvirga sp.]